MRFATPVRSATSAWNVERVGRAALLLDLALVLVLALHLGGAQVLGSAATTSARPGPEPWTFLGRKLDTTGCATVPRDRKTNLVRCQDFTAITSKSGRTLVVSVYGPDAMVTDPYAASLPEGLAWGEPITDVVDQLGKPRRITPIWGTPTLVYMYEDKAYGSLELRFDECDELTSVNACLTH